MSAATRRAFRQRDTGAKAREETRRAIAYHAECESQHLAAAENAKTEDDRLVQRTHAEYHRKQHEALARKLEG